MRYDESLTLAEMTEITQYAAYIVVKYGDVYSPVFERLERELNEMRARGGGPRDRAQAFLKAEGVVGRPAMPHLKKLKET